MSRLGVFQQFMIFLSCLMLSFPLSAQDTPHINSSVIGFPLPDRVPITVENADQVVELARIGSGMIDDDETVSSADGSLILFASSLGVWVYNAWMLSAPVILLPVDAPVASVTVGENLIAGGDEAGNIHLWYRATLNPAGVLTNHLYAVRGLAFNADGSLLASADQSGVVRLWDVGTLTEQAVVSLPGAYFDGVLFDGENRLYLQDIASAEHPPDFNAYVYNVLWSIDTNTVEYLPDPVLHTPLFSPSVIHFYSAVFTPEPIGLGTMLLKVAFMRSPEVVAFGSEDFLIVWSEADDSTGERFVNTFTLVDGEPLSRSIFHELPPLLQTQAYNGDTLAVGGDSSRISVTRFRDLIHYEDDPPSSIPLFGHTRGVPSVTFSPTDSRLLVSGSLDTTLRLWDVTAPPDTPSLTVLEGHQSGVTSVDINAAGDLIASASFDGTIRLWGIPQPNS